MTRCAALCVAAAAIVVAGCGSDGGVADRFSGTWRLRDGRTIPLRHVGRPEGERALRALGGKSCGDDAIYFRATYFGGLARLAGCATGDGMRMTGRFDGNGRRGRIVQRLVRERPATFVARVIGDGARRSPSPPHASATDSVSTWVRDTLTEQEVR